MTRLVVVFSIILFSFFDIGVYGCQDRLSSRACAFWKERLNICVEENAEKDCAKTCGLCNGVTSTVTAPTTTKPTTKPSTTPSKTTGKFLTSTFKPSNRNCGISQVSQGRVVNGVDAKPGAWPWIVSLQIYGNHFCGASLITSKWVLTASHCVRKLTSSNLWKYKVVLGAHVQTEDETSQQNIGIKRVILHPDFDMKRLNADIALLELTQPALLNERVVLACMPQHNVYPAYGKECYIAGWGSIRHPGPSHHTLQQARLPVVDQENCHNKREVVCVGKGMENTSNGRQQPNACRGDSGGPLVCQQSDGRWQLEGVASYVYMYCKYYTAYAPVNKYLSWIKEYVKDL